jgi:hypothetical protein
LKWSRSAEKVVAAAGAAIPAQLGGGSCLALDAVILVMHPDDPEPCRCSSRTAAARAGRCLLAKYVLRAISHRRRTAPCRSAQPRTLACAGRRGRCSATGAGRAPWEAKRGDADRRIAFAQRPFLHDNSSHLPDPAPSVPVDVTCSKSRTRISRRPWRPSLPSSGPRADSVQPFIGASKPDRCSL